MTLSPDVKIERMEERIEALQSELATLKQAARELHKAINDPRSGFETITYADKKLHSLLGDE